jgi:MFS family permease
MKKPSLGRFTSKQAHKLSIAQFLSIAFLYWVAAMIFVPILPVYVKTKTDDLALVGMVLSTFGLVSLFIRLPFGIVSDWLGRRKPFILAGLCLLVLGALIMAGANGIWGLAAGRAVTGIAAGVWVLLAVAFSSLFPSEDAVRAIAMLAGVSSAGRMIGSMSAGFLADLGGYSLPFFVSAAAAVLAFMLYLPARETHHEPLRLSFRGAYNLMTRREVVLPALLNMVSQYAVWASTFSFIPILAQEFGASNVMLSTLMSMTIALQGLGSFLVSRIVRRFGGRRLVYLSYVLSACALLIAAFADTLPAIFFAQFLTGLSGGIDYPTLMGMSIEYVGESERSTAMGLHQSIVAISMFLAPYLSGLLADMIGIQPMLGVTALFCFSLGMMGTSRLPGGKRLRVPPPTHIKP